MKEFSKGTEVVIFESKKAYTFEKKGLNNDFYRRNGIRGSTISTGSGSKEKVIFFPKQNSYIH